MRKYNTNLVLHKAGKAVAIIIYSHFAIECIA